MVKEKCIGIEEVFSELITSFVDNNRVKEALRVLEIMNSAKLKPSIQICNVLLGTLVEEEIDLLSILFAYKEMVKAGIVPNIDTLNYLIQVLLEDGRIEVALDQYRRMDKKGCKPNGRTFEILLKSLCMRDQVDESVIVLDEMFEIECKLDWSFYCAVIPIYCEANKLNVGMKLFSKMRDTGALPGLLIYKVLVESSRAE
ncbi:hypothetical protein MKX01_009995 [Papaver californicum]|nr:hypothetical protein MKX01_009995 [Papaver californicum]